MREKNLNDIFFMADNAHSISIYAPFACLDLQLLFILISAEIQAAKHVVQEAEQKGWRSVTIRSKNKYVPEIANIFLGL